MRPSLAMHALAAAGLLALSCMPGAALAGDAGPAPGALTDSQSRQLQLLSERIDLRLKAGLAGSEKQAELMRSELMQIAALKDPAAVAKMIASYQASHAAFHSSLMTKSGVRLADVAKEMQQIAPAMRFEVKSNGTIVGRLSPPAAAPAPPSAVPAAKTLTLADFSSEGTSSCGAISGGSNSFTATSTESRASATVAGRCVSRGTLRRTLDTGGARRATLTVRHGTGLDLLALSIVGASTATGVMTIQLDAEPISVSSHLVWAPLLWAASEQASTSGVSSRVEVPVTESRQLRATTQATASAAIGADTRAMAAVRDVAATLQLEY